MLFKTKVKVKLKKREKSAQELQDFWSARDFIRGLRKGETLIGSMLFSGNEEEVKIIKQLCRYLDYSLIDVKKVLCTYPDTVNTFYVTHYEVM